MLYASVLVLTSFSKFFAKAILLNHNWTSYRFVTMLFFLSHGNHKSVKLVFEPLAFVWDMGISAYDFTLATRVTIHALAGVEPVYIVHVDGFSI